MTSKVLRNEVLAVFRKLHKTRQKVFREDIEALTAARQKINEEFKRNIAITDETTIKELVKYATEVEHELRTTVIQAVEVAPGRYVARITEDTAMMENVEFDISKIPDDRPSNRGPCCQDPSQNAKQ